MKPTMLQTVLGLPSRTYHFPSEKNYYRNDAHMRRVATGNEDKEWGSFVTSSAVTHQHSSEQPVNSDDDDSDEEQVFYTPNTSPRSSMAGVPFPSELASSSTSLSSDGHSIFSSESSPSTHVTTPPTSDSGHGSKRSSVTYTDEDWAKEVRWLVHPNAVPRTKPKVAITSSRSSPAALSIPSRTKPPKPRMAHTSKSMSKVTPSIMMSMAALLEEDEDNLQALNQRPKSRVLITPTPLSKPNLHRRRSRSLEHLPLPAEHSSPPDIPSHGTPGYTSLTLPRAPPPPFLSVSSGSQRLSVIGGGDGRIDLTVSGVAQTTMASVEVVQGLGLQTAAKGFFGSMLSRKRTVSTKTPHSQDRDPGLAFTSYRKPPEYISGSGVLVQIWAVSVDGIDVKLVGAGASAVPPNERRRPSGGLMRSVSLRSKSSGHQKFSSDSASIKESAPDVGFVPGRSFVGRVLECGWEVRNEIVKKGEWVVGLLDIKKCGALQEFIVVDRHRVHRVPHPLQSHESETRRKTSPRRLASQPKPPADRSSATLPYSRYPPVSPSVPSPPLKSTVLAPSLSLEEFSLLPLCGVAAYRAVRALELALSSDSAILSKSKEHNPRRALVLRGHEGTGAMIVQMLVRRGWRVSAHVPLPIFHEDDEQRTEEKAYMQSVKDRIRAWGAEEAIFDDGGEDEDGVMRIEDRGDEGRGAIVRVLARLVDDGDVFDAVLDTVGGKDVWAASERLLRGAGHSTARQGPKKGILGLAPRSKKAGSLQHKALGQFVTLVGDYPERPIPSASDLFKTGLRSLRSSHKGQDQAAEGGNGKVGYAWVNIAQDVDWEGEDIRDSLGVVASMALNQGIRPFIGDKSQTVANFERAPRIFIEHEHLTHGGATIIKVVS